MKFTLSIEVPDADPALGEREMLLATVFRGLAQDFSDAYLAQHDSGKVFTFRGECVGEWTLTPDAVTPPCDSAVIPTEEGSTA